LIVASTASFLAQFNHRNINILQKLGYEVHVAANFTHYGTLSGKSNQRFIDWLYEKDVVVHNLSIERGFGKLTDNINAVGQLNKLMKRENFEFIHVHTPIASVLGRLAAWKNKVPVVYTAHGFHFSKTSPLINWVTYPIEWLLSFVTYQLIVINQEDYNLAKKHLHAKRLDYQAGVGVNYSLLIEQEPSEKQQSLAYMQEKFNLPSDAKIIVSVGELSRRKNHRVVIEALHQLNRPNLHYIIAGKGPLLDELTTLAIELHVRDQVHFLKYTTNIRRLNLSADVSVLPSLREGLSRAGLEAIRDGVYLIGSDIRGIRDYILNEEVGVTFKPRDSQQLAGLLEDAIDNPRMTLSDRSILQLMTYDRKNIDQQMEQVYQRMGTIHANRLRDIVG